MCLHKYFHKKPTDQKKREIAQLLNFGRPAKTKPNMKTM